MDKNYVCVNIKGELMGIDYDTDGYPFSTKKYGLCAVKFWTDLDLAQKTANQFGLIVKEFSYNLLNI